MDISTTPAAVTQTASRAREVDVTLIQLPFAAFYEHNSESIARALAVTLGDSELAADAMNEAMTRAYQRWTKISRYDNPAAWVYRVGLNWSLSWKQRRRRERDRPVSFGPASASNPELDDRFDLALGELSVDHRAVVVCRIYLDWSVAQTAEALNIAPGTVKSRLARALEHLKAHVDLDEEESS